MNVGEEVVVLVLFSATPDESLFYVALGLFDKARL